MITVSKGFTNPSAATSKTAPTMYDIDLFSEYDDPKITPRKLAAYDNSQAGKINGARIAYQYAAKDEYGIYSDMKLDHKPSKARSSSAEFGVTTQIVYSVYDDVTGAQTDFPLTTKVKFEVPDQLLDVISDNELLFNRDFCISALTDQSGNSLIRKLANCSLQRTTDV